MHDYSYYKNIFTDQRLPLAFVDMDLLDKNIDVNLNRAGSTHIRIASKSIRCSQVMHYIFSKSPQFQGIMAFYGEEAVALSKDGFDDILMGYPISDSTQIEAMGQEIKAGKYLCLMIDSPQHLEIIEPIGKKLGIQFPICIDMDMSIDFGSLHFGVWRSPINDQTKLGELLDAIKAFKHVRLDGLMGYEAQIAGLGNQMKGKALMNRIISFLQKKSIPKVAERRAKALELIKEKGFELKFVNGGGTGSIESTIQEEGVTEVTVGSGFFNSHLFDYYSHFQLEPAAAFAIPIARIPKQDMYTAHGGGYIASGGIDPVKAPLPYLPAGLKMDKNEGAGEVQTPLYYKGPDKLEIGDPVFFRHCKAGELCERFNELHFVREGKIINSVPTYRGEGKCYL
ncbi:MAG: amino acid deaminase/aldolase [Bacteroidota bacterium]